VEARDQKLCGAGELHRFNRDVEDALSRMQEKYASIPEELGRDLKTVQSYIKKHEGFENDLVALEAQVRMFRGRGPESQICKTIFGLKMILGQLVNSRIFTTELKIKL